MGQKVIDEAAPIAEGGGGAGCYNTPMSNPSPAPAAHFATTRWSLIVAAQQPGAPQALADLCRLYWYPLYAYVRRRGHDAGAAEDLTQAFFAHLLEHHALSSVSPQRGRFRSFLLASCQHFLANERQRANALKRGGGRVVSLEPGDADGRYRREPDHEETPERLFERRWALELLDQALQRLRGEYEAAGKGALFDALKGLLGGDGTRPYADLAEELALTEGAIKSAVHRLRKRYGEILREQIRETVATEAEVDEEVQALFSALGG
jgi:RNA polymerase sigma-70 factor (ECF subfamily)